MIDDWVEDKGGNITWRDDVNKDNYNRVLKNDETYRGTSYQRQQVWTNVNVRSNNESGLMKEGYEPNGKLEYTNLTPWVDKGFEELGVALFEGKASNPRIEEYLTHTQLTGAAINDATSWCAGFMNWTLETGSNVSGTGSGDGSRCKSKWTNFNIRR